MKTKYIILFYIISIFMIANDALFNYVGMLVGFSFWRQIISLIGFFLIFKYRRFIASNLIFINRILRHYKRIFVLILILSFITFVIDGFSLTRIIYSCWNYFFGIPFLLFPFYCKLCGWTNRKFNILFIFLGSFLSLGILLDFLTGGFFSVTFRSVTDENVYESGRFTFLSTAPTIFTVYYCLCLFCCFDEFQNSNSNKEKYFLLLIIVLYIFSSFFCGSRQTLVSLLFVAFVGFFNMIRNNKSVIFILIVGFVLVYLMSPKASDLLSKNQGFQDRYTSEAIKEDDRIKTWKLGLQECLLDPLSIRRIIIGDGVGYTQSKGATPGEVVGKHYENTFFARVSDVGWIIALWSLLLPVYIIIKYRKINKRKNLLYLGLVSSYLFISIISPNGASPTTQMSLFIVLGKFLEDNYLEIYENQ